MDFAVEMVKCVSDGADVTDVNIEDLVSGGMLAQLGANRYLPDRPVSLRANRWWGPVGASASERTGGVH